ncbi:MAG: site-specific integrase [Opitutaceae bacterium]
MIESVFKPSRVVDGKRVKARLYVGQYALQAGECPTRVSLHTPDREIALKRLREIVLEKQREREGIVAPKPVRDAAAASLADLITSYDQNLKGVGRASKHVHDTVTRLRRIVSETGWSRLMDIRSDEFTAWRAKLECSAKTKKEYQISLNAFLNWLVSTDRLTVNPLARLESVETRGKQVRQCRAFTEDELKRLWSVAGKHKLAYQVLLYTGQRKSEVRALVWGDLHLDETQPYALFREGTTKDKDKRAVPLRRELAEALKAERPTDFSSTKKVFWFCWPTYDILQGHLKRARIERKDGLGRVVHFHSFRKTWQTLGVRYGVNQRAAQEVLGHSDPSLTANVYTDVPALSLHSEMAKLPWVGAEGEQSNHYAQIDAQNSGVSGQIVSLPDMLRQLSEILQATGTDGLSPTLALSGTSGLKLEMAARTG